MQIHENENYESDFRGMTYQKVYPEIYYKIQPFVLSVCDQVDAFGCGAFNYDELETMTETIYNDLCKVYPEFTKYNDDYNDDYNDNNNFTSSIEDAEPVYAPMYNRRYRRRQNIFRDMIEILLLTEIFRRRRY